MLIDTLTDSDVMKNAGDFQNLRCGIIDIFTAAIAFAKLRTFIVWSIRFTFSFRKVSCRLKANQFFCS